MLQEFLEIEELKSIHEEKLRLMEREMALSTPLLTELEYIPMLYKWYCELSGCCEESGGLNAHQKGQFLLIILFFYSPIHNIRDYCNTVFFVFQEIYSAIAHCSQIFYNSAFRLS